MNDTIWTVVETGVSCDEPSMEIVISYHRTAVGAEEKAAEERSKRRKETHYAPTVEVYKEVLCE